MIFLFFAQNAFQYVWPAAVCPLLLVGVIFYALTEGPLFGAVIGCFAGFLLDTLGVGKLGGSMTLYSLVGICTGYSSTKIFYDSFFTQILLPVFFQYAVCLAHLFFARNIPQGEGAGWRILSDAFWVSQPWFTVAASLAVFSFLKKVSLRHVHSMAWRG